LVDLFGMSDVGNLLDLKNDPTCLCSKKKWLKDTLNSLVAKYPRDQAAADELRKLLDKKCPS